MPLNIEKRTVTFVLSQLTCCDGIASYVELLAEQLNLRGWRTTLATGAVFVDEGSENRHNHLREMMGQWTMDPRLTRSRLSRPWTILRQAQILARVCQEHGTSILHLNGRALAAACWLQQLRRGTPYVNTMQLGLPPGERVNLVIKRVLGPMLGTRYIAISSETAKQAVERLGVPRTRVRLIHHGFNERFRPPAAEERRSARAQFSLQENQFVIAAVGRVIPIKRQDVIIDAAKILFDQGRDVVVLFAGEGYPDFRAGLIARAAGFGMEGRIRFLRHVDPLPVLWASDVKVLASDREGFGIVVPEAMATGLVPIRSQSEGAIDQIDHGSTGYIFPLGDVAELARILVRLADNPEERKTIGARAAQAAREKFSADAMAARTVAVYMELLDGAAPDRETLPRLHAGAALAGQ
jgi:glycosyltransferase involved in cell wall biosynthesis